MGFRSHETGYTTAMGSWSGPILLVVCFVLLISLNHIPFWANPIAGRCPKEPGDP